MASIGGTDFNSTSLNIVRTGTVMDRRLTNAGAQVRVTYADRQGVSSDWIPWGQQGTKGNIFYNPPPQVGDQITVLHFPTGIERGVAIATNHTPSNPALKPRSINAVAMQTLDGAYFEHDPDASCLSINGVASIYIKSNGQLVIVTGSDVDITSSGNVNVTASGTATVAAPNITLTGNVYISGTLYVNGYSTFNVGGTTNSSHIANADGAGGGA